MALISNIVINGFSVLLLIVLCAHSQRSVDEQTLQHKLYIRVLIVSMILLILDILSRTDGNTDTIYPLINCAGNFLLFLLNPVLPSIWLMYVDFQIYHDEEKTKRLIIPLLVLNAVNVLIVVISQFNGWYYFIDSNNIYHRGPFFVLSTVFIFVLLAIAFAITFFNKKAIDAKQLFSLMFFPIPPFFGIVLQVCFYGIAFVLNSVVLSLLIVLLNMKDDTIFTDYLTGIGNRKKLESVLRESVRKSSQRRTFSLVMMDIDNFKKINDTYGHEMGDNALRASAKLLKKCIRSKDYVARYGGDEFCLVLEIYDNKNLEVMISRINHSIDLLNDSGEFPFKLGFTSGYAVYDYYINMRTDDFIKHVDLLMYENKRIKKS